MINLTSSAVSAPPVPVGRHHFPTHVVRRQSSPVFGFILVGGALSGAQIRDVRLANELVRRGYTVHAWWAMDRPHKSPLDPAISQRWLFNAARYGGWLRHAAADDLVGQWICRLTPDNRRQQFVQRFPAILDRQLRGLMRAVCVDVGRDKRLIRRFAAELTQSLVTHVVPNLECLAPFAAAVRPYVPHPLSYLMTFQGYELYAGYTQDAGQLAALYARLAEAVEQSDWPAIAVSNAYGERICSDVGLQAHNLTTIPAGVPVGKPVDAAEAAKLVRERFPEYRPEVPLVSFVGRRDSEKGIDLLLYAARVLQARGVPMQLAICGPTAFGSQYVEACRQIAWNMRVPVLWSDYVSDDLRSALFRTSRAVVYPSIHEEPFGMVPVEAMAQGTPALVPDTGGVADLIYAAGRQGGLRFRSWDTGDLAHQIERLLTDHALHSRLAADAPLVADHFSVERMGERILDHLGLPHRNEAI
jgi:glycosyltransferase involved in cell wall biosynthesis